MKKLALLTGLLLSISYQVQAVPPPPPLPPSIGQLEAKVTMNVRVTDWLNCDAYLCKQTVETCTYNAKVAVVKANGSEEAFQIDSLKSENGQKCSPVVQGFEHWGSTGLFLALDESKKEFTLVTDTRSGKLDRNNNDMSTDAPSRTLVKFSALAPSFTMKMTNSTYINPPDRRAESAGNITKTTQSVTVEIQINNLKVQKN